MAKTIKVSAAQVIKYVKNPNVCSSWKTDIKSRFDVYAADEFDVPVDFIKRGLSASQSVALNREIKADFEAAIKAAETPAVKMAQKKVLAEETKVMAGVEICGASARNSKLPEAAGRGLFLDGTCDYMIRETKKGNYLIVPIDADSDVPTNFRKLSSLL